MFTAIDDWIYDLVEHKPGWGILFFLGVMAIMYFLIGLVYSPHPWLLVMLAPLFAVSFVMVIHCFSNWSFDWLHRLW